jgi:hypothetical protein
VARARVSSTARSRSAVHDQHPPAAAAPATAPAADATEGSTGTAHFKTLIIIIKLPDQAIASTPSAPRPPGRKKETSRRCPTPGHNEPAN